MNANTNYEFFIQLNTSVCKLWMIQLQNTANFIWPITISSIVLSLCNVITNSIALFIFYSDPLNNILTKLLIRLSLLEIIFQLLFFLQNLIDNYFLLNSLLTFQSFIRLNVFSKFYLWSIIPGITAFHIARNWMVVIVSFYRFEVLIRTFSTKCLVFKNPNNIWKITAGVILASILVAIPRSTDRNVYFCEIPDDYNSTMYLISGLGQIRYNAIYLYGYNVIALFILQTGGPTFLVCFASIAILLKLRERNVIRSRLKQNSSSNSYASRSNALQMQSVKSTISKSVEFNNNESDKLLVVKTDDPTNNEITLDQMSQMPQRPNPSPSSQINQSQAHTNSINKTSTNQSHNNNSGGRLVIILCIMFCICEMPSFFTKLVDGIYKLINVAPTRSLDVLIVLSNFATSIDSFANFFIYLLSNRRFRQQMVSKFTRQ